MQRLPSDNRVGGAVALNTSPEFLIPVPEITERFGECRLWTKNVFLWLDAELGELRRRRLAVVALAGPVAYPAAVSEVPLCVDEELRAERLIKFTWLFAAAHGCSQIHVVSGSE
jgi:hypothetical protein